MTTYDLLTLKSRLIKVLQLDQFKEIYDFKITPSFIYVNVTKGETQPYETIGTILRKIGIKPVKGKLNTSIFLTCRYAYAVLLMGEYIRGVDF